MRTRKNFFCGRHASRFAAFSARSGQGDGAAYIVYTSEEAFRVKCAWPSTTSSPVASQIAASDSAAKIISAIFVFASEASAPKAQIPVVRIRITVFETAVSAAPLPLSGQRGAKVGGDVFGLIVIDDPWRAALVTVKLAHDHVQRRRNP